MLGRNSWTNRARARVHADAADGAMARQAFHVAGSDSPARVDGVSPAPDPIGRDAHRRSDAFFWGQENGPNYYHPSRENPVHSAAYGHRDDLHEYRDTELSAEDLENTEQGHGPFDPEYARWRRGRLLARDKG